MQAVILAAGKGTRLKPLTENRSKALAPILDKPVVARVFDSIYANGIKNFVIVISPAGSDIEKYFRQNSPQGAEIKFAVQEVQDGSASAVDAAVPLINDDFLVSSCDSLFSNDFIGEFIDLFNKKDAGATMAVMKAEKSAITKSSAVKLNDLGEIVTIIEKPKIEEIDTDTLGLPLYIFKKKYTKLFADVGPSIRGEREIQEVLKKIINSWGSLPCIYATHRYDVTSLEDLKKINLEFLEKPGQPLTKSYPGVQLKSPVFISGKIKIGRNCIIGPRVFIEDGASLGENVSVVNSVVLKTAVLESNSEIVDQICV